MVNPATAKIILNEAECVALIDVYYKARTERSRTQVEAFLFAYMPCVQEISKWLAGCGYCMYPMPREYYTGLSPESEGE